MLPTIVRIAGLARSRARACSLLLSLFGNLALFPLAGLRRILKRIELRNAGDAATTCCPVRERARCVREQSNAGNHNKGPKWRRGRSERELRREHRKNVN